MSKELYAKYSDIIEELAKIKGRKFARGYYSAEDIEQEVRLKCFLAISKFDSKKANKTEGAMKTFLNVATENHLRNLMRDKFVVFNPPCRRTCDHYDCDGRPLPESWHCQLFIKYWRVYQAKKSIRNPVRFSNISEDFTQFINLVAPEVGESLEMLSEEVLYRLKHNSYDLWLAYQAKLNGVDLPVELEARLIEVILE